MKSTIALLFIVPLLAGCVQDAEAEEPLPSTDTAPPQGILAGSVVDDAGRPLAGARISVLATPAFTSSDADGDFSLKVATGNWTLQVTAEGYDLLEKAVEVQADQTTRLDLVMLPNTLVDGEARPHIHDYWGGLDEVVIVDAPFYPDIDENNRPNDAAAPLYMLYYPNANISYYPIAVTTRPSDGGPALVYPGTGEVQVTLTWDESASTLETIGLYYHSAGAAKAYLERHASAQTWTIPVTPEMTDHGHQAWTFWDFAIYYGNSPQSGGTSWEPGAVYGDMHVEIKVIRGEDPPLEPPHPDFWLENGTAIEYAPLNLEWDGTEESRTPRSNQFRLPSGSIIPPGTQCLRMAFQYTVEGVVESTMGREYELTWRSADMRAATTPVGDYLTAEPVEEEGTRLVYQISIEAVMTDQYYQRFSIWAWVPQIVGDDGAIDRGAGTRSFDLALTAFNSACA